MHEAVAEVNMIETAVMTLLKLQTGHGYYKCALLVARNGEGDPGSLVHIYKPSPFRRERHSRGKPQEVAETGCYPSFRAAIDPVCLLRCLFGWH